MASDRNMVGDAEQLEFQTQNHAERCSEGSVSGPVLWFQFVISSVNNLKKARHKVVNQSENGYG